jgi:hypothetical protein
VNDARPGEKFIEGRGDALVGDWIGMGEEDRGVWLPRFVRGDPIEIAFAVGSETEPFAPALCGQIKGIRLALTIEREKGFDPFGWVLRLGGILGICGRAANFDLLGENGLMIIVEGDESLREERADSLLNLVGMGMDEAAAERIARRLALLWSQAIARIVQELSNTEHRYEHPKCHDKWAKGLGEQRLHPVMILETRKKNNERTANNLEHEGSAGGTSVLRKLSPLNSNGSPVAFASA